MKRIRNPRPIPIDRDAVEALLDRLYYRLAEKAERYGDRRANDSDDPMPLAASTITMRDTRGDEQTIRVILTAAAGRGGAINGGGKGTEGGRPVVIVEMNGRLPWSALADERITRDRLGPVLRHELTHAVDVFNAGPTSRRKGGHRKGAHIPSVEEIADVGGYYNHPSEVSAYLREIYEELRRNVTTLMRSPLGREWGLGGVVSRMVRMNPTWEAIEPHLTPKNRQRILRGLVRAFQDDAA